MLPFTYVWKFQAAGEANWTTLTNSSSQIAITNAQTTNAGSYQIIVSNSAGSTKATTNLVVDCGPLVLPIPNSSVRVGGTATLNPAVYGTPPFSFQWKFKPEGGTNEIVVTDDPNHISGATTAVLVITNAQKAADAGTYSLGVTNLCSTNEYQFAQVAVLVVTNDTLPPSLAIINEDFQAVSTSTVTLSGTASDEGFGDNGIASVKANGLLANNSTASGSGVANWSLVVTLSPGTNAIKVVATDNPPAHNTPAHNSTTNVIHIISDTVQPTLAITAPTAGQRWSNAVFTVNGKATDNRGVAIVWCQTNGVWGSVTTTNGWTNWNVAMSPMPGTNTVRAYSQDAASNVSPTQTVSFTYVLTAPLNLAIVGKGTVAGATNGQRLELGKTVTLTATPGTGYVLTNWLVQVDGLTVISTNRAVPFGMRSNLVLTATFADVTKPVLTITAPTAGTRWSNAVFTVVGKVTDNGPMDSVACQVNGDAWNPAQTANAWTNWTAEVNPTPGTNTVRAYAVDAAGNRSATNSVSFTYVLTAPLNLAIVGKGTVAGATNGQRLELGKAVTLTATPGTGYVLTNWLVQVDGVTVISTNRAVPFGMRSNLVLTATFADVTKPLLTITAPTAGTRWSNAVFTVVGKVTDNGPMDSVACQVNGGAWNPAQTDNAWTNWTAEVNPTPGTNTVRAYAVDAAGNRSATNSVSFTCVLAAPLLSVRRTPTNAVVVSWASPWTGFSLLQHTNLTTTNWVSAPETVNDNGTENFILVNPTVGSRFYRLQKP